uniref:Uncharacterized protein n=1 Tax=Anguilla anguilla TaxID=7936 RepID=A0A0E9X6N6_ANGAN
MKVNVGCDCFFLNQSSNHCCKHIHENCSLAEFRPSGYTQHIQALSFFPLSCIL